MQKKTSFADIVGADGNAPCPSYTQSFSRPIGTEAFEEIPAIVTLRNYVPLNVPRFLSHELETTTIVRLCWRLCHLPITAFLLSHLPAGAISITIRHGRSAPMAETPSRMRTLVSQWANDTAACTASTPTRYSSSSVLWNSAIKASLVYVLVLSVKTDDQGDRA